MKVFKLYWNRTLKRILNYFENDQTNMTQYYNIVNDINIVTYLIGVKCQLQMTIYEVVL